MYVYRAFDTSDMTNKSLKCNLCIGLNYFLFLSTPWTWYYIIFVQPCKIPCSMHGLLTPLTYPGSCKVAFLAWWEDSLNISMIYQIVDQNLALYPLADSCPGYWNYPVLTGLVVKMTNSLSSLIDFREIRPVWHFRHLRHWNYLQIYIYCIWSDPA